MYYFVTLKSVLGSLKVIGNGTIRQMAIRYELLFVFHYNYGVLWRLVAFLK